MMKAVIFDLDGTLVHSSPDIAFHLNQALGAVYGNIGTLSDHDVEMLIGGGMLDLIDKGVTAIGVHPTKEEAVEVLGIYRAAYLESPVVQTTLYDGVVTMLDALSDDGYALGLCTNKSEATAYGVLDHFGLTEKFGAIIGGDTTPHRKPDAAPLLEACRHLDCSPAHAVMVGDSKADYGAAVAAESKIVLVDWGYSSVDITTLGGDAVISSYDRFGDVVSGLLGSA